MTAVLARCDRAARTYGHGSTATVALQPVTCEVRAGDRIAVVGPSGSGKSTLLHLVAGLDRASSGEVSWPAIGGRETLRPGPVAMVFQGPSLLRELTVAENVALPLVLAGSTASDGRRRARDVLERLELRDLADALPEEVSGGQAQRVSVARALVGDPQLILADEPTGQLDRATATTVVDVLLQAALANGAALLVATHDPVVAERLDERWEVHAGRLETGGTVWPR